MASPLRDLMAAAAGKLFKDDDSIFDLTAFLSTLATQLAGSGISVNDNSLSTTYEAKSFSIGAETDYNTKTAEGLFGTAHKNVKFKTDIACIIKLNDVANDPITLQATEELPITGISVTNIFVTSTAATSIRIIAI